MMKKLFIYIIGAVALLTSCSGGDYRDAIPSGSTALISMDPSNKDVADRLSALNDLLHIDDPKTCGIDLTAKMYFFETADGNLGLCAKVKDYDDLSDALKEAGKDGPVKAGPERQGCNFFTLSDKYVIGFNFSRLLIMGPVVAAEQGQMMTQITQYLKQDDDEGMTGSQMMDKLDEIEGGMAMVAYATALPEKFVSLFTLGLPKDADASQCVIAASVSTKDNVLHIEGTPMSFNTKIDKQLKEAYNTFRPIKDRYINSLDSHSVFGMYANVDGTKFLPMLQQNEGIMTLLAGINQAIDINAIIRSIDGDMLISSPSFSESEMKMSLAAQLKSTGFLGDVDYWKQSVPQGGKILDWKKDSYYYTDGKMAFYFGVSPQKEFFSGSSKEEADQSIAKAASPLAENIQKLILGKRIGVVISLTSLFSDDSGASANVVPQMLKINDIVYTVK